MLFIAINGILFFNVGIRIVDDSPRYLEYAAAMKKEGFYIDPHNIWYVTYALFILLTTSIYDSIGSIIIGQYLFAFLGLISLYHTSLVLYKNESVAFLTSFLFLVFFKMSLFNSYILCESLYISLTCISFYFLSRWFFKKNQLKDIVMGIVILGLTVFTKPTGIALLGGFVITSFYIYFQKDVNTKLKWFIAFAGSIIFLGFANHMVRTFGFIENYKIGEIIYGVSQYSSRPNFDLLIIARPEEISLPSDEFPPLVQMVQFIYYQPVYWLKLFFGKLLLFFAHVRPFWSIWHNLFSILFLLPVYVFFTNELNNKSLEKELKIFALIYIGLHALSVGMMSVDWDGRFLLPVLPILLIFSVRSIANLNHGLHEH